MNRYYYYIRKYLSKVSILINIIFLITETIINLKIILTNLIILILRHEYNCRHE